MLHDLSERLFALYYPRLLELAEDAGQREIRRALIGDARGRTLELGAGSGVNLPHYTDQVSELVVSEPSPHMLRHLREAVDSGEAGPGISGVGGAPEFAPRGELVRESTPVDFPVRLLQAPGEAIPEPDASFDTIVATFILCTTPDPDAVLREIARLLRPGGRFLFYEHVHAGEGTLLGKFQDLVETPHTWVAAGCHPNRRTEALLERSPLRVVRCQRGSQPRSIPTVRPTIIGAAERDA